MFSATKLATAAALSVWLSGARGMMPGARDHGQDDGPEEGSYTLSPVGLGLQAVGAGWPASSWTSPFWPTTAMLTGDPDHFRSSVSFPSTHLPPAPTVTTSTGTTVVAVSSAPASQYTGSPSAGPTASSRSETLVTAMPSSTETTSSATTTTGITSQGTQPSGNGTSGMSDDQTLVITLSAVLSVVGALLILGAVVLCWRYRQKRLPFFHRGISPIDDEEIATWKMPRGEKAPVEDLDAADRFGPVGRPRHAKQGSTSSRKPPSVIVYNNAYGQGRPSVEASPPGGHGYFGKISLERDLPPTPIQARAPNAVAGLTDESVPGADPFVATPRRHPSRLSKAPPSVSSPRAAHTRTRSSRSSLRSFGDYGGYGGYYGSSDIEFSPRGSQDHIRPHHGHSRVYSTSELPPRLSFGDDGVVGGLSPRPLFRDEEIGRAIG